jgi:hypothetical protein
MAVNAQEGEEDPTTLTTTMTTTMTEEAMGALEVPAVDLLMATSLFPGSIGDDFNDVNDEMTKGEGLIWAQLRCGREAKGGKNGRTHTLRVPPAHGSKAAKIRAVPRRQFSLPHWSTPTAHQQIPQKNNNGTQGPGGEGKQKTRGTPLSSHSPP